MKFMLIITSEVMKRRTRSVCLRIESWKVMWRECVATHFPLDAIPSFTPRDGFTKSWRKSVKRVCLVVEISSEV
jgi:hypothetical protein